MTTAGAAWTFAIICGCGICLMGLAIAVTHDDAVMVAVTAIGLFVNAINGWMLLKGPSK